MKVGVGPLGVWRCGKLTKCPGAIFLVEMILKFFKFKTKFDLVNTDTVCWGWQGGSVAGLQGPGARWKGGRVAGWQGGRVAGLQGPGARLKGAGGCVYG